MLDPNTQPILRGGEDDVRKEELAVILELPQERVLGNSDVSEITTEQEMLGRVLDLFPEFKVEKTPHPVSLKVEKIGRIIREARKRRADGQICDSEEEYERLVA